MNWPYSMSLGQVTSSGQAPCSMLCSALIPVWTWDRGAMLLFEMALSEL